MHRGLVFMVLMLVWVVLSGNLDAMHLTLGVISCGLVTWMSGDMVFYALDKSAARMMSEWFRLVPYLLWLTWEVVLANFYVLWLALSPNGIKHVRPRIVQYETYLKSDFARFVFANSITLTPGTITLRMEGNKLWIHAISEATVKGIGGTMEKKIAQVFGELPEA